MPCKETVSSSIRKVSVDSITLIDPEMEAKDLKFDLVSITGDMLSTSILGKKVTNSLESIVKNNSILRKLGYMLNSIDITKFEKLPQFTKVVDMKNPSDNMIFNGIALQDIIESIKGEVDKANNNNIDISKISQDGIFPNIPLARLAGELGRKKLHKQGYRFTVNASKNITSDTVEHLYYNTGMKTLIQLEKAGLIHIGSDPKNVIKDFLRQDETFLDTAKESVTKELAISLNFDNLLNEKGASTNTEYSNYILNRGAYSSKDTTSKLDTIIGSLNFITKVSTASYIVLPSPNSSFDLESFKDKFDYNSLPENIEQVRESLSEVPSVLPKHLSNFLSLLKKEYLTSLTSTGGVTSVASLIKGTLKNVEHYEVLFGLHDVEDAPVSNEVSKHGQNTSVTAPLEDLLEYFEESTSLDTETGNRHLYTPLSTGRNARLYYKNTVLNPQTSKLARHLVQAEEYSLNIATDSTAINHLIDNVLDKTDYTFNDIKNEGFNKKLEQSLKIFDQYTKANTLQQKLNALAWLSKSNKSLDIGELTNKMKAIKDIREGINSDTSTINTTYLTSTDMTASGGSYTLMEAIGTSEEVLDTLKAIGILKGDSSKKLNDIYGILTSSIQEFLSPNENEIDYTSSLPLSDKEIALRPLIQDLVDTVFKGNVRELSKPPTMTIIYRQGKKSAIESMAKDYTKIILDKLDEPKVASFARKILNEKPSYNLYNDVDLKNKLISEFSKKDGITQLFQNMIKTQVNDKLFKKHFELGNKVYSVVKHIKGLKILPAYAVLDKNTKHSLEDLLTYGMPLEKVFNIAKKVNGDTVFKQEERPSQTVFNVTPTHGKDSTNIYLANGQTMEETGIKNTVISIHDDNMASASYNVKFEKNFKKMFKQIATDYSIYEETLLAAQEFDPTLSTNLDFTKLLKEVQAIKETRKRIIEEHFNEETTAIIGEKPIEPNRDLTGNVNTSSTTNDPYNIPFYTPNLSDMFNMSITDLVSTDASVVPNGVTKLLKLSNRQVSLLQKRFGISTFNKITQMIKNNQDKITLFDKTSFGDTTSPRIDPYTKEIYSNFMTHDITKLVQQPDSTFSYEVFKDNDKALLSTFEVLAHEIDHKESIDYIIEYLHNKNKNSPKYAEMQYIENTIIKARKMFNSVDLSKFDTNTITRIKYALYGTKTPPKNTEFIDTNTMLEFTAIMRNEPDFAESLMDLIYPNESKGFIHSKIKEIIEAINKIIKGMVNNYFKDRDTKVKKLESLFRIAKAVPSRATLETALDIAFIKGLESTYKPTVLQDFTSVNFIPKNSSVPKSFISYHTNLLDTLNRSFYTVINSKIESASLKGVQGVHKILLKTFPVYSQAVGMINNTYNHSKALQQIVQLIGAGKIDKVKKNKILSLKLQIDSERMSRITDQLEDFHVGSQYLKDSEKVILNKLVTKVPLHDYFLFADTIKTEQELLDRVTELSKDLTPKQLKDVNNLVQLGVYQKVNIDSIYNLSQNYDLSSPLAAKLKELVALLSLKEIGASEALKVIHFNNKLTIALKDNSIGMHLSNIQNIGSKASNNNIAHIEVQDLYKEPVQMVAFGKSDFRKFEYEDASGWIIVTKPTDSKLGLAYRKVIDTVYQEGSYTDVHLTSQNIDVSPTLASEYNEQVIKTPLGSYKRILTQKEKEAMGVITDPAQIIVKSAASAIAVQESQVIRDTLLKSDTTVNLKSSSMSDTDVQKLVKNINSENVDHAWFIKLASDINYSDLPEIIRNKYKPVHSQLSDVKGFNSQVSLVRKDIAHWLVGAKEPSFFRNPKLKYGMRILKDVISMSKISMVLLNPKKLALDEVSNISYLVAMGVPVNFIYQENKNILENFNDFMKLKNQTVKAKTEYIADPTNVGKKAYLDKLNTSLKAHSLYSLVDNGFINSLGSDILSGDLDTVTGLQADINKALTYLLKNKKGNNNAFGTYIMQLSRIGYGAENLLSFFGSIASKSKSTKELEYNLDKAMERLKRIKSNKDVVAYVTQYLNAPNAETTKFAASFNDMLDASSKEVYKRHLISNKGLSEKEAVVRTIEDFPDYKENLPTSVKVLSDTGILLFPSFWARIQKTIYRMVKEKPINVGFEYELGNLLDSHLETILDANIYTKATSFGGIFHSPFELVEPTSVVPTNIFNGFTDFTSLFK